MASISLRESIRWLPAPASEPTETRVLTSPGRRFVDVRILKEDPSPATSASSSLVSPRSTIPFSRIDWAFAGFSSHIPDGQDPNKRHCEWSHFVDSRSRITDGVVDKGTMTPLPRDEKTGRERAFEVGKMVNPDTGLETEYEEVWVDVEPEGEGRVLELVDEAKNAKGMVVLAGNICQGVLRKGDRYDVEVWLKGEGEGDDGKWERSVGYCSKEGADVGELEFLCETMVNMTVKAVGDKVAISGYEGEEDLVWDMVECW